MEYLPVPDACDCHVHVIGPQQCFPMQPDRPYTPPTASVDELRKHLNRLSLARVVLVQPSFYGTDNSCMKEALDALGSCARGVAVVDAKTSMAELHELDGVGVKGARINLASFGADEPDKARTQIKELARLIAPLGWHLQLYASAGLIASLAADLSALPVNVVLDHFAMLQSSLDDDSPVLAKVMALLEAGNIYVKLSAPYRISEDTPGYANIKGLFKALVRANPERLVWGSDWPHTQHGSTSKPTQTSQFRQVDDQLIMAMQQHWFPSPEVRTRIMATNPAHLYGF